MRPHASGRHMRKAACINAMEQPSMGDFQAFSGGRWWSRCVGFQAGWLSVLMAVCANAAVHGRKF